MFDQSPEQELTDEQRRLYAAEKLQNFRWIYKILAKRSKHILTAADEVSKGISVELDELGAHISSRQFSGLSVCWYRAIRRSCLQWPHRHYRFPIG